MNFLFSITGRRRVFAKRSVIKVHTEDTSGLHLFAYVLVSFYRDLRSGRDFPLTFK